MPKVDENEDEDLLGITGRHSTGLILYTQRTRLLIRCYQLPTPPLLRRLNKNHCYFIRDIL